MNITNIIFMALTSLRISDIENQESRTFITVCVHCTLPKVRLTVVLRPSFEHNTAGLAFLSLISRYDIAIGQRRVCFVSLLLLSPD